MVSMSSWQGRLLSVLRIVVGLLFLEHGTQKLFGFPPGEHAGHLSAANFTSLAGLSGVFEFVGGLLILLGLFTRPTAFVLSGMMAVAYWMVHFPMGPYPVNNMGDAAILYCFVFLYLAANGPGPISLDARRRR